MAARWTHCITAPNETAQQNARTYGRMYYCTHCRLRCQTPCLFLVGAISHKAITARQFDYITRAHLKNVFWVCSYCLDEEHDYMDAWLSLFLSRDIKRESLSHTQFLFGGMVFSMSKYPQCYLTQCCQAGWLTLLSSISLRFSRNSSNNRYKLDLYHSLLYD